MHLRAILRRRVEVARALFRPPERLGRLLSCAKQDNGYSEFSEYEGKMLQYEGKMLDYEEAVLKVEEAAAASGR